MAGDETMLFAFSVCDRIFHGHFSSCFQFLSAFKFLISKLPVIGFAIALTITSKVVLRTPEMLNFCVLNMIHEIPLF